MVGIYKITNPTGKIYIGQSVDIEKRFYRYRILSKNIQLQVILYRSFLKYGVDNHEFEIIEECNVDSLNEKERYYQDLYNVINGNGLNCVLTKTNNKSGKVCSETLIRMSKAQIGNNNWLGRTHSQESKDKMSESKKGKRFSKEVNLKKGRKGRISNRKGIISKDNPKSVRVVQITKDGLFVKNWDCLMDIKRELNYHIGNVSSCMSGKLNTYKGYKWKRLID